ncbi:GNAT family N-acetyltransferase [Desulfobacula toluolica]|uniref:4-hydroxybutyrate CoA-transferase n=1 Tax=Desulfobacula toluolica (strain DSM 7467 / Tol2) TaxID=651182 RepID=K0NDE6_DESTT|nr:GNAT family N-acetyltransferase [Desulfobacula toluolica]CCK78921.1 4-hydroxybutyrate CoA-transferase [Desulfobacula toluolica Tol2]
MNWKQKIVDPDAVMKKIKPGMRIFLGTGISEPQTLVKQLMRSDYHNLADLELIQLVNFSDAISLKTLDDHKYRFKTFSSGNMVNKAISQGLIDLIPTRFNRLQRLFDSGRILVDAAFIQITPPDNSGNASLGVSLDVARSAMKQASFVAGEINPKIPRTFGNTFVNVCEFDLLVHSNQDPVYFQQWETSQPFDRIAENIASLIQDKSCIAFSIGPLFESLGRKLAAKHHLGVHSPVFTDALMYLIKSGAVTNLYKTVFQGKSIASYAFGTPELLAWLDRNHFVEFQEIQTVFDPVNIGKNSRFIAVIPARKADLTGRIALHHGKGNVISGPMELMDTFLGAQISKGGRIIFALPSRNLQNHSNIMVSIERYHNQLGFEESIDMIVTEYGTAMLNGLSIRERALALIEIAHPDDRPDLFLQAKQKKILYPDQIFSKDSSRLYPHEISDQQTFKHDVTIRFRPIKPSDEEQMRRLFYRFSDESIYYRYFHSIATMPHAKMQEYVNIDWKNNMSIVGLAGEIGHGILIAEARYLKEGHSKTAEVAIIVDEHYNSLGIATHMVNLLKKIGQERGIEAFTAEVLFSNRKIMKVFKKAFPHLKSILEEGVYRVVMPFNPDGGQTSP